MVLASVLLFTFLLNTITASSEPVFDGYDHKVKDEDTGSHGNSVQETAQRYVHDAQAGLSHMLDELKAFQKRLEHSVLHAEKGGFVIAAILCSIAMVVLVAGALYFHWFGNYVPKYVRVLKKNGREILHEEVHRQQTERLKSE